MQNNTIVLAVTGNAKVNNLELLPTAFTTRRGGNDYNVIIHSAPSYEPTYDQKKDVHSSCNFDLWLNLDYNPASETIHQYLLGNKYRTFSRLPKSTQWAKLTHFLKLNPQYSDLFCIPKVFGKFGYDKEPLARINLHGEACVLVKDEDGARGISQALVPASVFSTFIARMYTTPMKELQKMFPTVVMSSTDDPEGYLFTKDQTAFVSEYLENIDAEVRLMVGGDYSLAYRRTRINKDGMIQANIDKSAPIEHYLDAGDLDYHPPLVTLTNKFTDLIKDLVKFLNLGIGSIDLFFTDDGRIGVFEFQQQFGVQQICRDSLHALHQRFVEVEVHKYLDSLKPKVTQNNVKEYASDINP